MFDNVFSIPGTQDVTNTVPFYRSYGSALGVFYLSNKPTVNETVQSVLINDASGRNYDVDQRYFINESSYQFVFNPSVTSIADITNIKKEIVMLDVDPTTFGLVNIGGTFEQIGNRVVYTGVSTGIERIVSRPNVLQINLSVRISFDVIPRDGSPKCTIVKTFLANKL